MTQLETQTVDQYVMRLTQRANNYEFGENLKEHVRDQVVDKCRSSVLRRKFLEKGNDLTLGTLQTIARAHEAVDSQARSIESKNTQSVNLVRRADNPKPQQNSSDKPRQAKGACFRCGQTTHFACDKSCPARGKKCRLCEKYDHFVKCCKTKAVNKKLQSKPASGVKQHIKLVQESSKAATILRVLVDGSSHIGNR